MFCLLHRAAWVGPLASVILQVDIGDGHLASSRPCLSRGLMSLLPPVTTFDPRDAKETDGAERGFGLVGPAFLVCSG